MSAEIPPLFQKVPERNTGDNLLRTAQQHHVQLSAMADVKANIIITVSSIVLTLSFGNVDDKDLRLSAMTLIVFTLAALLLAILAVLPPQFNLLFFGHFAELPRERFLKEISRSMTPDGSVYESMAKDLYSLGYYLSHFKYRYLRLSYLFFLTGFILATLEQLWRLAFS